MKRWRFFLAQFIWVIAMMISGIAGSEGDPEVIPFIMLFSFVLTGFTLKWGAKGKNESQDNVMGYNAHIIARVMATALIWITYLGGTVTAVIEMAGWGILLALILMIPATAFTALIWAWERISGISGQGLQSAAEKSEKRKRQSLNSLVNNLSDDDLHHLRDRLADSRIEEELQYDRGISDDGELVYRH